MYRLLCMISSLVGLSSAIITVNRDIYQSNFDYTYKCGALNTDGTFMDMHDGDKKSVKQDGETLIIKPHDNNETWVVHALIDSTHCNYNIDFNVPGKPNPPPVNLTATFWLMVPPSTLTHKVALVFTDPSGTLAAGNMPLNVWTMNGD